MAKAKGGSVTHQRITFGQRKKGKARKGKKKKAPRTKKYRGQGRSH